MNRDRLSDTAAIVLCGGKSRRMGRPKAWLPFGADEVMLQRVARLVSEVVSKVVVVAAPGQDLPPLPDFVLVVRDEVSDRGPLQGIATGLSVLPVDVEFAFVTSTDAPFLNPEWIRFLRGRADNTDLVIPSVGGFHQPLAALYRCEPARQAIFQLLQENRMRPYFLTEQIQCRIVEEAELRQIDPQLGTIRNLNTIEEYENAIVDFEAESRQD